MLCNGDLSSTLRSTEIRILVQKDSLLDWRDLVRRNTPDAAEMDLNAQEAQGSTPLFDVRLEVVTRRDGQPCVSIVPSLPAIEDALMRIMDHVVTVVKVRVGWLRPYSVCSSSPAIRVTMECKNCRETRKNSTLDKCPIPAFADGRNFNHDYRTPCIFFLSPTEWIISRFRTISGKYTELVPMELMSQ